MIAIHHFFQATSRERARTNRINALKEDGTVVTSHAELEVIAMEFYANLFTRQEFLDPGPVLDYVPEKVTEGMNELLMQPHTAEEIRKAVFMMGANKASSCVIWSNSWFLPATLGDGGAKHHSSGSEFFEWRGYARAN